MTKIEAHETRLENLRKLIAALGGPTVLSHRLRYANGSYLAQLAGPNPTRPIGERTARGIEDTLEIPRGWLDQPGASIVFPKVGPKSADLALLNPDGTVAAMMEIKSSTAKKIYEFAVGGKKYTMGDYTPASFDEALDERRDEVKDEMAKRGLDSGPLDAGNRALDLDDPATPPQRDFRVAGDYTPGPRDLPVFGSFKGGFDGNTIDYHDPVEFIERPRELIGVKKACGVYIVNDSMEPRYFQGEMALVHPGLPVKAGDHVAVELINGNGLIKKLVKKNDDLIVLSQYNPPEEKRFKRADIAGIYRIIGTRT